MKTSNLPAIIFTLFLGGGAVPGTLRAVELSPEINGKIEKAIKLRDDQAVNYFTTELNSGKAKQEFESLVKEVGNSPEVEKLEKDLKKAEGKEIYAKFALWALDQKRRPELYNKMLDDYVNDNLPPPPEDPFTTKPKEKPPGPTKMMNAAPQLPEISLQDLSEERRLPLEFAYFSPPMGRPFLGGGRKQNLATALATIGNDNSIILLTHDIYLDKKIKEKGDRWSNQRNTDWASCLLTFSSVAAFDAVAKLWAEQATRPDIEKKISMMFGKVTPNEEHDQKIALRKKWEALASEKLNDPERKAFAEWLVNKALTESKD